MKIIQNKKGFLSMVNVVIVGIVLAILAGVFLSGSFFVWILSINIFNLIGAVLLILAGLALFKGIKVPVIVWFIGAALVIIPMFFKGVQDLTLGVVLG